MDLVLDFNDKSTKKSFYEVIALKLEKPIYLEDFSITIFTKKIFFKVTIDAFIKFIGDFLNDDNATLELYENFFLCYISGNFVLKKGNSELIVIIYKSLKDVNRRLKILIRDALFNLKKEGWI